MGANTLSRIQRHVLSHNDMCPSHAALCDVAGHTLCPVPYDVVAIFRSSRDIVLNVGTGHEFYH